MYAAERRIDLLVSVRPCEGDKVNNRYATSATLKTNLFSG